MKLTYYGHSCFAALINGKHLLFDPFVSANEKAAAIDIHQIQADYILVSHAHADHFLDCLSIALRTGAKVICSWEVHEWLQAKGVHNTHPMNVGGKCTFDDFTVRCTVAQHSSSFSDGMYGGNAMGFIVYAESESFYYSGDTALSVEMQLIPGWAELSFAVLPIGDNFTMGIRDAIHAAQFVKTTKVIGVHFDTFEYITIDHQDAIRAFENEKIELILMDIGETREV
ncbi:MAG: metal-dependent hydrolase [Bacteroidetes bacterium]|nr:metal-dependent hydrolase [Bacteroidota bacterium]